jgi:hypothetical protein
MIPTNVEVVLQLELTLCEHNQYYMFFFLSTYLRENTLHNHGNHSH